MDDPCTIGVVAPPSLTDIPIEPAVNSIIRPVLVPAAVKPGERLGIVVLKDKDIPTCAICRAAMGPPLPFHRRGTDTIDGVVIGAGEQETVPAPSHHGR